MVIAGAADAGAAGAEAAEGPAGGSGSNLLSVSLLSASRTSAVVGSPPAVAAVEGKTSVATVAGFRPSSLGGIAAGGCAGESVAAAKLLDEPLDGPLDEPSDDEPLKEGIGGWAAVLGGGTGSSAVLSCGTEVAVPGLRRKIPVSVPEVAAAGAARRVSAAERAGLTIRNTRLPSDF